MVPTMKKKLVLGLTGMPGAGKAIFREIAQEMGYSIVIMGDEIRIEAKRMKLEPTPENLGFLTLKLREEKGADVLAKRCIPKIEKKKEAIVVVDGLRSLYELEEFKRHFPNFILIAIHTSPKARFERLFQRKRGDDPTSWETFLERDSRELNLGLGSLIATADYMIINEGSRNQLRIKTREILKKLIGKVV